MNEITTIIGNKIEAFIEIPFAIYAYLPNPAAENKPQLLCLGAVFNDTFFKKSGGEVSEDEIFTPFYSDERGRDRWEMAKIHMASCDNNDFTIRTHLGILHYASSIYTCALSNIARDRAELRWLKDDFVDVFSRGLLQIDFNANLTLIDHVDPMAEKIFYLRRTQSAEIILLSNLQFNILDFCPEQLEKDCFISDSVMISSNYYQKLKLYIDFLICKNWESISDPSKIYRQLLAETADDLGKLDGLPVSIVEDSSPTTLRKILTNLAYLWVVFHAQTFSLVSVASPFYYVPSIVRKPLSALSQLRRPLSDDEKMEWLPNTDIIRDNMTLHKVVTFRMVEDSLISRWSQLSIDEETWGRYLIQWKRNLLEQEEEFVPRRFFDFWNDLAIRINNLNSQRLN